MVSVDEMGSILLPEQTECQNFWTAGPYLPILAKARRKTLGSTPGLTRAGDLEG